MVDYCFFLGCCVYCIYFYGGFQVCVFGSFWFEGNVQGCLQGVSMGVRPGYVIDYLLEGNRSGSNDRTYVLVGLKLFGGRVILEQEG